MKRTLINCPYCLSNQKIFHISYYLKNFLNKFKKEKIFILGTYNKKQEIINEFNCNNCSETLFICYDIEKLKYFVNGKRIEELRSSILNNKIGTTILKRKLIDSDNEQIKDFLKIKINKEENNLNYLIQKEKELTERTPKEHTQV